MKLKIKILSKYKSISPCEFELPYFSVLTGKNGSGKSHLLQAINDITISETYITDSNIAKNIKHIEFNGLNPIINEVCNPTTITQFVKNAYAKFNTARDSYNKNNRSAVGLSWENIFNYISFNNEGERNRISKFITKVKTDSHIEIEKITEDDFADNFDISLMEGNDFFTAQFALLFKDYHKKQEENNYNNYCKSNGIPYSKGILSKIDFEKKYGIPPWDLINNILEETNIPYHVNNPLGSRMESTFNFKLIDNESEFEISSNDLSTGEKVLMSLALAIYNTGADFGKPDLLLIDEPDAGLHPAMSKKLVDVLRKHIVQENNIPVIITTHSPTTVISSDGISIYQVVRGESTPKKIPIQDAVELLTSEIPFLKITTEKRRQIFVENKNDVNYYEQITNIYSRLETLPCSPIFISTRKSKHTGSNCSDVQAIVKSLNENGNDSVYGIIDRDSSNKTEGQVLVLGNIERYAIENFLLDPLLMGLLFIREAKITPDEFGITEIKTYSEISKLTKIDAQKIIDKILLDLELNSTNIIEYKLYNNWNLSITSEFCEYKGHDIEEFYKQKYPFLNAYNKEEMLKKDIINKVLNDYPQFAPIGIIETIRKII